MLHRMLSHLYGVSKKYGTIVLILIVVAAVALALDAGQAPDASIQTLSLDDQTSIWRERIRAVGPEEAHDEFARFEEQIEVSQQHKYAHIFGRALYKEEGLDGVGVCDMRFQFGCLHEYFGHVIAEYGLEILPRVAEACLKQIEKDHPCQHGMGHGILASLGYDDVQLLNKSLEVCNELYTDDPINGCMGGAFMEFNLYESLGSEASPRNAVKDGWYSPCVSLGEEYQRSCAWWLPQWWHEYMKLVERPGVSVTVRFERLGELCRNFPVAEYRRDCFQQLGQMTVWGADFELEETKRLCSVATQTRSELTLCLSYAAYMMNYYDEGVATATAVCADLKPVEKAFCDMYARKQAYTPHDMPLPLNLD